MIFFIIYIVLVPVVWYFTATAVAKRDEFEDDLFEAVGFSFLPAMLWPIAAIGLVIYHLVNRRMTAV